MRHLVFQRRMTLLALLAMLLLLAVPTAGRLAAGLVPQRAIAGAWEQMCTMGGLKLVQLAPDAQSPFDASMQPSLPGSGMAGGDCEYCPLLAGMALLILCIASGLLRTSSPASDLATHVFARFRHPSGLDSRGPELSL